MVVLFSFSLVVSVCRYLVFLWLLNLMVISDIR